MSNDEILMTHQCPNDRITKLGNWLFDRRFVIDGHSRFEINDFLVILYMRLPGKIWPPKKTVFFAILWKARRQRERYG